MREHKYTGVKDKNGKQINKGDIFHLGDINIKYEVIFDEFEFVGQQVGNKSTVGLSHWLKMIEVIGNIHETPELLGKVGV